MHPLVSIIIPCYNAEKYVAEAIQSALNQTNPDCEVIVIDDGSTDGSLDVIKSFGDKIRWETGTNRGGCAARNTGLRLASGDFIQFLDADDRLDCNKVKEQVASLANSSLGSIACCPWHFFDVDDEKPQHPRGFWKSYPSGVELLVDMWLDAGFFSSACWLTPAELLRKVGDWNEELSCDQDGEYFGRVLSQSGRVVFVNSTCCWYRTPNNTNVSRGVSEKALWSKAEAIKVVSIEIQRLRNDARTASAIRKRWIGFAIFCSLHSSKWMAYGLKQLKQSPPPDGNADELHGVFLRVLTPILGIAGAIRIRGLILRRMKR